MADETIIIDGVEEIKPVEVPAEPVVEAPVEVPPPNPVAEVPAE